MNLSYKLVKYANDLTLYAAFSKSDRSTIPAFQLALDQIAEWAVDNNNMLVNASKTKLMHISLFEPKYVPSFTMNSQILKTSESAKLLGVTIDTKLSFSEHIKDTYSRLGGRI